MARAAGGMRCLVLGGRTGMLGQALVKALSEARHEVLVQGRDDVDVTDAKALGAYLEALAPQVVCNAVAYTQVDKAEDEPDQAALLNKTLPETLARLSGRLGFKLMHYSTDFVFDGKANRPYEPGDPTGPCSVYGRTKLAGEKAIQAENPPGWTICRTAWLFGPGRKNFVTTILNLCRTRDSLNVVDDQIGSPTCTIDLAAMSLALLEAGASGLFHLVNAGEASWCDLASEAVRLTGLPCSIHPIPTSGYPTKAARPAYSVLSTQAFTAATGQTPRPWAKALREYVFKDLKDFLEPQAV